VEQLIGRFFGTAANRPQPRQGSIQLALDGKTLRGTIPKGENKGVHLLAICHQPHRKLAGTSALPNDFRTARTVEKGHGRGDMRAITVSSPAFRLQHLAGTGSNLQIGKPED